MVNNNTQEIWKDIEDYEGLYQVSNLGRIKSLEREVIAGRGHKKVIKKEKILHPTDNSFGYLMIQLTKNGAQKNFLVHRLVAKAFIPNPNNYPEINHKDENKYNNCVENLEWCTKLYNMNYGTRKKRQSETVTGGGNPMAKKVLCVTTGKVFDCTRDAREYAGLNGSDNISACCRGEYYTAGRRNGVKLRWRYLDDKDHEPFKEKWEEMEKKYKEKENKRKQKLNNRKKKK